MTRYRIDPTRSRVVIDASSSLHPIRSESEGLQGWIELGLLDDGTVDPAAPATAHLELPVNELRGGNPLETSELKRRIDARRFPTINGDLSSIEVDGVGGRYRVRGDVTFKGVTRPSEDEMTIEADGDGGLRLRGSSAFDIRDFGMEPPKILLLRVHPDVTVTVDIYATEEG